MTAPSVGTCEGTSYTSTEALLACLLKFAFPKEYQPRDMILGAPGDVVKSTLTSSPPKPGSDVRVTNMNEVNQWRANPQAWIDAKNRAAKGTGITTENWERLIAGSARWGPRLLKATQAGLILEVGSAVGWVVRDNILRPALGLTADDMNRYACNRMANVVVDFIGSALAGADCPDWRLKNDFQQLVNDAQPSYLPFEYGNFKIESFLGKPSGYTVMCLKLAAGSASGPGTGYSIKYPDGSTTDAVSKPTYAYCTSLYPTANADIPSAGVPFKIIKNSTGEVVGEVKQGAAPQAQWITRVRCLDGITKTAISDAYQQQKLGTVVEPQSVQLGSCKPVGVDLAMQRAGIGAGGGWSSVPGGQRTTVQSGEVPTEVQDWMRDFPQCWDGSCQLLLKKKVGTGLLNCFDDPEACLDWDAERVNDPTRYECWYAGVKIALERCAIYNKVFDKLAVRQGVVWEKPDQTTRKPTGQPTNPGVKPVPEPGTDTESSAGECWPQGWAVFNPVEWVLQPVKCALKWAFVPSQTKIDQTTARIQIAAMDSVPGQFADGLKAWGTLDYPDSGCMGPPMTLDIPLFHVDWTGYPLQACTGVAADAAALCRLAVGIMFVFGGFLAISTYFARVFGFTGLGKSGE